jgi:A/G-specific adenine glycosylase
VPDSYEALINLPYIGEYTANAILCFGFKSRRAIVDNNILRLFSRIIGIEITQKDIRRNPWAWDAANIILPQTNYIDHNYGLLDFTADTCTFYNPKCKSCPLNKFCIHGNMVLDSNN